MNQARYIITAFLLLFIIIVGIIFITKISTTNRPGINIDNSQDTAKPRLANRGEVIFKNTCAQCHSIFKDMTGPALKDLEKRGPWGDRKKLYEWIHNPPMFMSMHNDQYTKNLKERFQIIMTSFPTLSEKDIDEIVDYINSSDVEAGLLQ